MHASECIYIYSFSGQEKKSSVMTVKVGLFCFQIPYVCYYYINAKSMGQWCRARVFALESQN